MNSDSTGRFWHHSTLVESPGEPPAPAPRVGRSVQPRGALEVGS